MRFSLKSLFVIMTLSCIGAAFPPLLVFPFLIASGLIAGLAIGKMVDSRKSP